MNIWRPKNTGRSLFGGLSWVLLANVAYLGSSAILTLLLPRFISPFEFGLWQLYQLFSMYFGYVTLGYSDGLNLRLAGRVYETLNSVSLAAGTLYLAAVDLVLFLGFAAAAWRFSDTNSSTVIAWAALGAIFFVPRTVVTIVFQSTGKAKWYSTVILSERVILIVLAAVVLAVSGEVSASSIVIADVTSKILSLGIGLLVGRKVFLLGVRLTRDTARQFLRDCAAGLYVLFANLSAMLINGGIRLAISAKWGLVVFGQVSLAFQVASLFTVLVNSVAISVLPNLKRLGRSEYAVAYLKLRGSVSIPLIACLPLCIPLQILLELWLPKYEEAGYFMALLFPLYFYEGLNRGITAVFMKALRVERALLATNITALAVGMIAAIYASHVSESLHFAVLSIVIALSVRALLSEIVVARAIRVNTASNWMFESALMSAFLFGVINSSWLVFAAAYVVAIPALIGGSRYAVRRSTQLKTASVSPETCKEPGV